VRVVCDFNCWLFHLDDLSDEMDDKSTVAIRDEIMNTFNQPHTHDPKTYAGKLTKRFVRLAYMST